MQKIIGSLLFLHCILVGCSQNKIVEYKRLKITQTAAMLTLLNKTLEKNTVADSVFIIATKDNIRIVQLPVNTSTIIDTTVIHKSTILDYFVYSPVSPKGLYFDKLQGLAELLLPTDSVMESRVDKYTSTDTMRCLKEQPVIYTLNDKDLVYSYPNKIKADENYDFDSVRFVYTSNELLKNEYLSKLISTKEGHFLYKTVFYFKQTFDKRINNNIPEREVKIEISESDAFDKEEVEKVLAKYKMVFN